MESNKMDKKSDKKRNENLENNGGGDGQYISPLHSKTIEIKKKISNCWLTNSEKLLLNHCASNPSTSKYLFYNGVEQIQSIETNIHKESSQSIITTKLEDQTLENKMSKAGSKIPVPFKNNPTQEVIVRQIKKKSLFTHCEDTEINNTHSKAKESNIAQSKTVNNVQSSKINQNNGNTSTEKEIENYFKNLNKSIEKVRLSESTKNKVVFGKSYKNDKYHENLDVDLIRKPCLQNQEHLMHRNVEKDTKTAEYCSRSQDLQTADERNQDVNSSEIIWANAKFSQQCTQENQNDLEPTNVDISTKSQTSSFREEFSKSNIKFSVQMPVLQSFDMLPSKDKSLETNKKCSKKDLERNKNQKHKPNLHIVNSDEEINKEFDLMRKRLQLCDERTTVDKSSTRKLLKSAISELEYLCYENLLEDKVEHKQGKSNKIKFNLHNFNLTPDLSGQMKVKCPPFNLLLDHTIAVIWRLFSDKEQKAPIKPSQLKWAQFFLMNINGRQKNKEVEYCIRKIEDEMSKKALNDPLVNGLNYTDIVEDMSIEEIKMDSEEYKKLKQLQENKKISRIARETLRSILNQCSFKNEMINTYFDSGNNTDLEDVTMLSQKIINCAEHTNSKVTNFVSSKDAKTSFMFEDVSNSISQSGNRISHRTQNDLSVFNSGAEIDNNLVINDYFTNIKNTPRKYFDSKDKVTKSCSKLFEDVLIMSRLFEKIMDQIRKEKCQFFDSFIEEYVFSLSEIQNNLYEVCLNEDHSEIRNRIVQILEKLNSLQEFLYMVKKRKELDEKFENCVYYSFNKLKALKKSLENIMSCKCNK